MLRQLPEEARSIRPKGDEYDGWDIQAELLAQLIELTSVIAAERVIKEPREVPRPWDKGGKRQPTSAQHVPAPPQPDGVTNARTVAADDVGRLDGLIGGPDPEFSAAIAGALGSMPMRSR